MVGIAFPDNRGGYAAPWCWSSGLGKGWRPWNIVVDVYERIIVKEVNGIRLADLVFLFTETHVAVLLRQEHRRCVVTTLDLVGILQCGRHQVCNQCFCANDLARPGAIVTGRIGCRTVAIPINFPEFERTSRITAQEHSQQGTAWAPTELDGGRIDADEACIGGDSKAGQHACTAIESRGHTLGKLSVSDVRIFWESIVLCHAQWCTCSNQCVATIFFIYLIHVKLLKLSFIFSGRPWVGLY